jgi:hypothetical protein
MTSAWWLLVAFVGGGSAGILLMALMQLAGSLPEQSDKCPRGSIGNDPIRVPGREEKFCSFKCCDLFVDANHFSQAGAEDRQIEGQYFERCGQQMC